MKETMIWGIMLVIWVCLLFFVLSKWQKKQNAKYNEITIRVQTSLTEEQKAFTLERAARFHGDRVPQSETENENA